MTSPVSTAERVAHWLKHRDLTLQQAADRTGLQKNKLWRITAGKQDPKLGDLARIAAGLELTLDEFLGELPPLPDDVSSEEVEPEDDRSAAANG